MGSSVRYVSVDVLRGMTIAAMILVNTPGSWSHIYPPLRHAAWHGCTPTDLVFPFFLFIVGASMWFSFSKFQGQVTGAVIGKVLKRTAIIFLIGLGLNAFPFIRDYGDLRILGVLQRIALAYGATAFLCLYLKQRALAVVSVVLLLGYWAGLYFGGGANPYGLETNLVRAVDLWVLGADHVWQGTGVPFDPEGLLSTIPSVVTTLAGYATGALVGRGAHPAETTRKLVLYGVGALGLGWLWGFVFPINKALWTSSYVLYTAGWAWLFLALLVYMIDLKQVKAWTQPFVVFGSNPLFVYVLSILWVKIYIHWIHLSDGNGGTVTAYGWLFDRVFAPLAGNLNGSLLFAVVHVLGFWLAALVLYRKKIFIKI